MSTMFRPIFMATHPRACSTAFERVFMTRRDVLECAHEPFGDAFYYGPERLSERFADDEDARVKSGFADSTYKTVMDRLENDAKEGKRVFIKDIAHYLLPPDGKPAHLAPSLCQGLAPGPVDGDHHNNNIHHGHANGDVNAHTAGHVNGPTKGNAKATTNGHAANGQANGEDATAHINGHVNGPTLVEAGNPTVMPTEMLRGFHFTFLIRHPRRSIPSYYRCTVPPLDEVTGFRAFMPSEAGYHELRSLFDYLLSQGIIGPARAGEAADEYAVRGEEASITVVDADDLLQNPEAIVRIYCDEVGIDYSPRMLRWEDEENQAYAANAFEKWYGFHHDAIDSTCLKPRSHGHKELSVEAENEEWRKKFGDEAAKVIRETVDANVADYEYLKSFAIQV